jgi:hypothetical protein
MASTSTKSTTRTVRPKSARKAAPKATRRTVSTPVASATVEVRTKATAKPTASSAPYADPRKALFAYLGASDVAIATVRGVPGKLTELGGKVGELPGKLVEAVRDPREMGSQWTTRFVQRYDDLALRGEKLAGRIRSSAYTKRAISRSRTARSQVKGAVTSVRKAVDSAAEASREALKKVS